MIKSPKPAVGWSVACFAVMACTEFEPRPTNAAERLPGSVAVGTTKQLFVDDFVVERMTGVARELGPVQKMNQGRPISFWRAAPDGNKRPMPVWQLFHSVYYDQDRRVFRMWCRGLPSDDAYHSDGTPDWNKVRYVYCESVDGFQFELKKGLKNGNAGSCT